MDKYYYFVSQLPFLVFNEKTYINKEYFLAEAKKWLSNKDFEGLILTDINDFYFNPQDNKVLSKYKNFEKTLREEIAFFRRKENQEGKFSSLNLNLRQGTALEIEKRLLKRRWQFIESLEQGHFFDLEILILYFLKIQVLERLFSFDKDKGAVIFDKLSEVKV